MIDAVKAIIIKCTSLQDSEWNIEKGYALLANNCTHTWELDITLGLFSYQKNWYPRGFGDLSKQSIFLQIYKHYFIFIFFLFVCVSVCVGGSVCVCMSVCHLCAGIHIDQKRALDPLELGYRPLSALSAQCLYWELNSDLLRKQSISEPSFQPLSSKSWLS